LYCLSINSAQAKRVLQAVHTDQTNPSGYAAVKYGRANVTITRANAKSATFQQAFLYNKTAEEIYAPIILLKQAIRIKRLII